MSRLNCRILREDRYAEERCFRLSPAAFVGSHFLQVLRLVSLDVTLMLLRPDYFQPAKNTPARPYKAYSRC